MPSDGSFDLLPPNATPYERALARGVRRLDNVPTPIRQAFRPYEAPESFLPFLAWERSVDIWDKTWPAATKRAAIARAYPLHKRKGTEYALREYIRYAGGTVTEVITPPQKVFSGPSLTKEEREAWLAQLDQVRVWRVRETWNAPEWKSFYGSATVHDGFFEGTFAMPSTAKTRLKRRARWVVNGVETDTTVTNVGTSFRLHLKAPAGQKIFCGKPIEPDHFYIPSDAWRRLVTIAPTPRLPWRSPVGPTLQAVRSEPERVIVNGTRGRSVFSDRCMGDGYFVPTTATYRVFERYPVFDGSKPLKRAAFSFMGTSRFGFPTHTAEVKVSIPGSRSTFAAGEGLLAPKLKFWMPQQESRVQRICRAGRSAKRLSDRILLKTGPEPVFVAGRRFVAGDQQFVVGLPN